MHSFKVCDVQQTTFTTITNSPKTITTSIKVQIISPKIELVMKAPERCLNIIVLFSAKCWIYLTNVNPMEVIGSEGCVALGAFPLPGVVASLDALEAEDMKALGQHSVLHSGVAARTC